MNPFDPSIEETSVHLCGYPEFNVSKQDAELETGVGMMQEIFHQELEAFGVFFHGCELFDTRTDSAEVKTGTRDLLRRGHVPFRAVHRFDRRLFYRSRTGQEEGNYQGLPSPFHSMKMEKSTHVSPMYSPRNHTSPHPSHAG